MRSLILGKVAELLLPVSTLLALYLLVRGHHQPGGGFVAGLVTVLAIVVRAVAAGAERARAQFGRLVPWMLGLGIGLTVLSGLVGVAFGAPFLTHLHGSVGLPGPARLGVSTAFLFDVGVYFVVVGSGLLAASMLVREGA